MQKKIAIINSVYGVGSTGRICKELSEYLGQQDFEVKTFYGRGKPCTDSNSTYKFNTSLGVSVHAFLSRIFDISGFSSIHSTRKLIKKLSSFKPDLIMVHNLHGYYLNVPLFLKWLAKTGIQTLFVFHDCWNFTGHCAYFDYVQCDRWKTGCYSCPGKHTYPSSFFFDCSKKHFQIKKKLFSKLKNMAIITPSEWLSALVKKSFLQEKEIHVINNGINTQAFTKNDNDFRLRNNLVNKKIILCVANIFDDRKGIKDIVMLNNLLSENEQIVVVGKIKSNVDLPASIIHIERTDSISQLANIYSASDVFFNPTYEDNFPTVNLEAMACKCPVVAYNTGGNKECIPSEFIVEKGELKRAYSIIKSILSGERKFNFPEKKSLDKKEQYTKYIKLIQEMLEK